MPPLCVGSSRPPPDIPARALCAPRLRPLPMEPPRRTRRPRGHGGAFHLPRLRSLTRASPALPHRAASSLSLRHRHAPRISEDDSTRFWNGPLPGDLSEVEAFCRLFRLSEQLHNAVMDALNSFNASRRDEARNSDDKYDMGFDDSQFSDGVGCDHSQVSDGEDIPLLEQKVVAGLGCIGALLHQHKQEVFSRKVSCTTAFNGVDDLMPPLASFRAEMKTCCKQLGPTLYCYFPPVDEQSVLIHRRFQKLVNVCFDVGYPRPERAPSHADIPNWAAVQLLTGKGERNPEIDKEMVLWRGGQFTEDGLSWLLEKGFKMIVDLRVEDCTDQLVKTAVSDAISSGRLRLMRLPVEPGATPTKDQVKAFAELVADVENHPLYLQSQEGVGRTSAMVSRYHEFSMCKGLQTEINFFSKTDNVLYMKYKKQESRKMKNGIESRIPNTEEHLVMKAHQILEADAVTAEDTTSNKEDCESCLPESQRENMCNNLHDHHDILIGQETRREKLEQHDQWRLTVGKVDPFEAQRPKDILSKRAMSEFRKGRRVVPMEFIGESQQKEPATSITFPSEKEVICQAGVIAGPAGRWGLAGPGIPRAGANREMLESSSEVNMSSQILDTSHKVAENAEESVYSLYSSQINENNSVPHLSNNPLLKLLSEESPEDDGDELSLSGDMCASTTGVVRLQSRKKAEMYLVRTDGFSCARERVKESTLAFTHPSTQQQMLMWKTAPRTALLLIKWGNELMEEAQQVASFLHYNEGINVVVEPEVHDYFARVPGFGFVQTFYNQDTRYLHEMVDFVVCLGGDGVVLHASNLFRNAVPPVVAFNLGSLGFLTAHPFEDFSQDLRAIIHGNNRVEGVYITLRMRLRCELFRDGKPIPGKVFDVLNEVVVDRGSSPYLCKIECFERNRLITKVQADGVIVATPTGSTAYTTAAGGSMVHPNVPCILFTPICPHSLSFRPVILPDSALLELKIPGDARSNAWVSFDGKKRQQLSKGDSVRISMSRHPLPTVNKSDQTDDWFCSLVRCFNWNERFEQKSLKY